MAEGSVTDGQVADNSSDEDDIFTEPVCFSGPDPDSDSETPPVEVAPIIPGGANAAVAKKYLWEEREILRVYFINPEVLTSWDIGVTPQMILDWANKAWRSTPNTKIPEFILWGDLKRNDIRVKFAEIKKGKSEGCWSMIGSRAEDVKIHMPTMMLDLSTTYIKKRRDPDDCIKFRRSLIIHEFGHALGLEHEHQRSDLWQAIGSYINKDAMESSDRVESGKSKKGVSTFGMDWTEQKKLSISRKYELSLYDSDSIMHYGFDPDWFSRSNLRRLKSVDKETDIPKEHREVIKGLHKRRWLAENPSEKDLEFLEAAYKQVY